MQNKIIWAEGHWVLESLFDSDYQRDFPALAMPKNFASEAQLYRSAVFHIKEALALRSTYKSKSCSWSAVG